MRAWRKKRLGYYQNSARALWRYAGASRAAYFGASLARFPEILKNGACDPGSLGSMITGESSNALELAIRRGHCGAVSGEFPRASIQRNARETAKRSGSVEYASFPHRGERGVTASHSSQWIRKWGLTLILERIFNG